MYASRPCDLLELEREVVPVLRARDVRAVIERCARPFPQPRKPLDCENQRWLQLYMGRAVGIKPRGGPGRGGRGRTAREGLLGELLLPSLLLRAADLDLG
jgi:hypothetical protein